MDPDPRLAGLVMRCCGYSEWSSVPVRRLQPAFLGIPMIISFGAPLRVSGTDYDHETIGAFVAGLDDSAATTEGVGTQAGVQLDLTPVGAARLLGMPLSEIARSVVAMDDVLGLAGRALVQRLGEANDWETRMALVEDFALRRIAAHPPPPPLIAEIWRRLTRSGGPARVDTLAADAGISRKHLTRQVQLWTGMAPSVLTRLVRFDRATRLVHAAQGRVDWGRVAQDCGYFDQSHFNRDFRAFTGVTPTAYAAALQPNGGVVFPTVGESADAA